MMETEETVEESEREIAEAQEARDDKTPREIDETVKAWRERIAVDYAHATVCGRIVDQIDAAREEVSA